MGKKHKKGVPLAFGLEFTGDTSQELAIDGVRLSQTSCILLSDI